MSARKESKSELTTALKEAQKAPHREDLWDKAEEIAAGSQRPDEVAELYRKVVRESDRAELLALVAPRAVRFHEEWYGAAADGLAEILGRVLEIDPTSDWALRRLSVLFTRQERWNDLLALYDRSLAAAEGPAARRELLDEALRIAKDFLGDADRTIHYLSQLLALSPGEGHLAGQLERLLERQGRWEDLAALWRSRVAALPAAEGRTLRVKVAQLLLDRRGDPAAALTELSVPLAGGDENAALLTEKILRNPEAPPEVRQRALGLLRERYEESGRGSLIVPLLQVGLEFAGPGETVALHRELADRLAASGDRPAAMEHLVTLLTMGPAGTDNLERLRHLSETQGDPRAYLRGLDAAAGVAIVTAQRIELLSEAAQVYEQIGQPAKAIEYQRRIYREAGAPPDARLAAARKLLSLLEASPEAEETPGERLTVLESLAVELPPAEAGTGGARVDERRGALVQAARLAELQGEMERAAGLLGRLLEADPADRLALDALAALHERNRSWEQLVAALWRRQAAARTPAERRGDLTRIARLQAKELAVPTAAIDTWLEIERQHGEDAESTAARSELYAATERWTELAELLARAGDREGARLGEVFVQLGDALRERLADPRRAAAAYARALEIDPTHPRAVSGARALVAVESCRATAVDSLARAYQATGDWRSLIDLLEVRLVTAADDGVRARLLSEAATLYERKGEEPAAALALLARALPLSPDDGNLERELARLGASTRAFPLVVEALRGAAAATRDPLRTSRLRLQEGQLRELELGDPPGALEAYREALERDPGRAEAREAVVRAAARSGRWDVAAAAAFAPGLAREALERTFLPLVEGLAAEAGAYPMLAAAAAAVLDAGDRAPDPALARDLEVRVARYFEQGGGPAALDRQEVALGRAAALARAARTNATAIVGGRGLAAGELHILQRLAELQRRAPGRALCETLLAGSELSPTDLDPLREAAAIALHESREQSSGASADPLLRPILQRLYDHSVRLLRNAQAATGRLSAEEGAAFAAEELGRLELTRPERSAAVRALELTLEATRLPVGKDVVRRLRGRAAEVALDKLKDRKTGIQLLRQITEEDPEDTEALGRLASLYAEEKRLPELLALRHDELGRTQKVERRLSLRLEMDKIAAALEERSNRLDMLRANLEELPGHRPTIETLARALESKGRHAELVEVLTDQATRLEERSDREGAARMWDWSAQILETPVGDRDRAIRAYERVAELGPRPETFEALGRLHLERGDALQAAAWLEQWQDVAQGPVRTRAALELAAAYLSADKRQRAIACLERALADDPRSLEVRARLVDLYRKSESWEPLVRTLNDGTAFLTDKDAILASAREAAEVASTRLQTPQLALGALERAVNLATGDKELRSLYADALSAAGEVGRSREILEDLIKEIGRRRSRERAHLHQRLAKVARTEGKPAEALAHLEQAADMDMDNAQVLEALGEVAEESGEGEKAERAYRALVMLGRRDARQAGSLSITDALLRLRGIARARGQEGKAQDLLDSAIVEAIARPEEARRLGQALRAEGSAELLRGVLDRRLAATTEPGQRANILAERAELQEAEGQAPEALESLLAALEQAPTDAAIRMAARRVARTAGASDRYATALAALAEQKRRSAEAEQHAGFLAEAGQVALEDMADRGRAAELWGKACQLGPEGGTAVVESAFSLYVLAAGADRQKALRCLQRLVRSDTPSPVRIEALYRLAEAQLPADDTRESGLAALAGALELSGDVERAFGLVRKAEVPDADLPRVLPLYERVARASGDDRMLLDFLERRAALSSATVAEVREGVELAMALNELGRAEVLLRRAVELARVGEGDRKTLEWGLLELAEVRRASGDIAGAVACLEEARDFADPARVLRLYQDIARRALESGGDPAVAARVYERLWEREPTERRTWEPLLSVYARLGDAASVERVATQTAERLFDPAERNAVRMTRARFLASQPGADTGNPALVEALRAVLAEQPTHQEAIEMLADVYQASGNEEGLTDLLKREIESAASRKDEAAVVALSVRLGQRLLNAGAPGDARDVYRRGLETAPNDVGLLRALAGLLAPEDGAERAAVLERLLENESGPEAARLAIELASLWESLGDEERVRRALETGVARAGGAGGVFDRLAEFYRMRHAWDRLAALMVAEVERRSDPTEQAALLKDAADIHRNMLAKPGEATELLRRARHHAPEDGALLTDLVASLEAVGERGQAIEELTRALDELPSDSHARILLLQTRADLHEKLADHEAAVADWEKAFEAGGDSLQPPLRDALARWKAHALEQGDATGERRAVRRLFDLLTRYGDEPAARLVLADWANRHPEDAESLRMLATLDQAAERWDAVVESAFRLVEVETGAAQISAAELLVTASDRIGQLAPAVAGLEGALRTQPDNRWLYEALMSLYERGGERRKQAALLLWAGERSSDPELQYSSLRQAGEIFLRERDLDSATGAFQKAIALRPADRELSLLVAEVYIAGGQLGEAENILDSLMKRAAKDLTSIELSSLQHRMAQLADARGDQGGRLDWLRRAFDTNRKNAPVAIELADLAESVNDVDLAVKALRAVTLLPPSSPKLTPAMAFLRQARIAQRSGDRPRAVIFAKRALQEDPRLSDAVDFLKDIGERRV